MSVIKDRLVSIVMPAYNAENTIIESIYSVKNQTYIQWELIIVDDCSHDRTSKIIDDIQEKDSRIKVVHLQHNSGPSTARNTAINLASGRWLAFLDADDIWLPNKLEKQLQFSVSVKAPISFTGFRRFKKDLTNLGRFISVPTMIDYNTLLGNTVIATSTVIIDRYQVADITMKNTYYDDFSCWLEILKSGRIGYGLNEDLMRYRVLQGSVSRNKIKSAYKVWRSYRDVENMGILTSTISFINYLKNAIIKYIKF